MRLRCIAVDDEPLALSLIQSYIMANENLELVQVFEDAIAASEYLNHTSVDLLFLDINMPDITGINLYKSLIQKPMVIFTTAYKNFAFEGFELNAVDYLLKPIEYLRFKKAINKTIDFYQYQQTNQKEVVEQSIFVHSEYRLVKIDLKDILYIESLEDYVKIHIQNSKMILSLMPLKRLLEKLPEDKFKRIHRSYVVPVSKVKSILNRKAELLNGEILPISNTYASFIEDWQQLQS
ncbi:LytTR family two component transcriptional regulator [Pedobacter psychrotolerans]|uniref:DNA-binding response regulator n=1 Tax=Pedobacter psychrotolerans TaxID=1843235 RepID=A0A4V6NN44_9SPHI|nr:LytTR family DNA-binding domain-containing protein [Pedobacter psychrotolerans]TCO29160.1 LytTR family two component transcriptional regulator [Pedobacter psychrotolerans]GGE54659.1 DNA-binding response regulator [Pedobacter psychrotolerans]